MTTKTYTVYAHRLPNLRARLAKINKRAAKYGFQPSVIAVLRSFMEEVKQSEFHEKIAYEMVEITITGETPVIAGWTLAAVISPLDGTPNNQICTFPGFTIEIPADYRTTELRCSHCGTLRRRAVTFLLWNETEGFKQVGRNCLADYTGALSPQAAAFAATFPREIRDVCCDDEYTGACATPLYPAIAFLARVVASMRVDGWVSRTRAIETRTAATASIAFDDMRSPRNSPERLTLVEADATKAAAVAAWAKEQLNKAALPKFDYNVAVAASADYIGSSSAGFAAYAVVMFDKAISERAADNAPKVSAYVGVVGGKVTAAVTVKSARTLANDYGRYGGVTFVYNFVDAAGNELVWWASSDQRLNAGDTLTITAKVKKHDTYKSIQQTTITHGKIA